MCGQNKLLRRRLSFQAPLKGWLFNKKQAWARLIKESWSWNNWSWLSHGHLDESKYSVEIEIISISYLSSTKMSVYFVNFKLGKALLGSRGLIHLCDFMKPGFTCSFSTMLYFVCAGCTQYYFGTTTGSFQTFNFGAATTNLHLANQNQIVCIRSVWELWF